MRALHRSTEFLYIHSFVWIASTIRRLQYIVVRSGVRYGSHYGTTTYGSLVDSRSLTFSWKSTRRLWYVLYDTIIPSWDTGIVQL